MRNQIKQLAFTALIASGISLAGSASATTYPDATGETISASILDISSVEVSNDSIDLIFKINLVGDPVTTDWGKYMIGFDTTPGGDTVGNGWGRPIAMASGMDYWVGSWVDSGNGAELHQYSGSWSLIGAPTISKTTSNVTLRVPFLSMGLSISNSFDFDVYTSGGGDGAIDALSTTSQSIANWGDSFTTAIASNRTYTIVQPPSPTNQVTFLVDMGIPIKEQSVTSGFDTNNDTVYVRGNFNGWPGTPGPQYALTNRIPGTTIYSNTVDIVADAGTQINYKFWIDFGAQEEQRVLDCNNPTRNLTLNGTNINAGLAYWGDRTVNDPTNAITFQVDMSFETAIGAFDPNTDGVFVRGTFNNFGNSPQSPLPMTALPPPNTNIYVATAGVTNWPIGACIKYKFWNNRAGAANSGYETGSDRQFTIATSTQTNAVRLFNDVNLCSVLEQTNQVTFSVNMAGATDKDGIAYTGSESLYLNGEFAGWWTWGDTNNTAATNLLMSKSGDIYSLTVPLPPGTKTRLVYKYSMNGADNEGGFGQDHVRYVRTTPGLTTYALPQDKFTGTNAVNIANLVEPKFGGLTAAPGAPGTVALTWSGLKCVQLQSTPSLTTPSWTNHVATDGRSSTNLPSASGEQYFRLIDLNP